MNDNTDIISNWVLQESITDITRSKEVESQILSNLDNEITLKVNELEVDSISEIENKPKIELHNLPLYIPQSIAERRFSAYFNHTYSTQRWRGYVLEINDDKFKAKLEDLTNPGTDEIGYFDIQDIFDEKELIKVGAVFYFSIGYDVNRSQYTKQRFLRFQRLSAWTDDDFNAAIDRADRIQSNLIWE